MLQDKIKFNLFPMIQWGTSSCSGIVYILSLMRSTGPNPLIQTKSVSDFWILLPLMKYFIKKVWIGGGENLTTLLILNAALIFHIRPWSMRNCHLIISTWNKLKLWLAIYIISMHRIFLIGILSMQGWIATMRHEVTGKRSTKRLKHAENLLRKNLQLKDVC